MLCALGDFQIAGVGNNIEFLARLVAHPAFRNGNIDTTLIEREAASLLAAADDAPLELFQAVALWLVSEQQLNQQRQGARTADPHSPWGRAEGWRVNGTMTQSFEIQSGDQVVSVPVQHLRGSLQVAGKPASIESRTADSLSFTLAGERVRAEFVRLTDQIQVFMRGRTFRVTPRDRLSLAGKSTDAHAGLLAPMPGTVIALAVSAGADVEKGAALLVMEAMKMEHTLRAPGPGRVLGFYCKVGDQVREGADLIHFEEHS
jgi:3-methylcrotonyl-CoA carboxylase alpha subunit